MNSAITCGSDTAIGTSGNYTCDFFDYSISALICKEVIGSDIYYILVLFTLELLNELVRRLNSNNDSREQRNA